MPPKQRDDKEIEALKRRRLKAQDKQDLAEEAKLCNAIGVVYMRKGDYQRALHYHQSELAISEGIADKLGLGIAHRKVGECLLELRSYEPAIQHQMKHLLISKEIGSLEEEQRALATLGRTYFVQSQSDEVGEAETRELLVHAGNAYLRGLDVCDKLGGVVPDRELLEMRSRLYLNLGLVYQTNEDLQSAKKFIEKALSIVKELGASATVYQCHYDLGSLYLHDKKPALALRCFRQALRLATELCSWQREVEVLQEMCQAELLMSNFQEAKSSLKKVIRLFQENSRLGETEAEERKLSTVRKVMRYSPEMEGLGVEKAEEKMKLCEKLGDLCCSVKAYFAAIRYYELQLGLAEAHGVEPKELSKVYVSLARTHSDCGQYPKALLYYEKELELWTGNATEECDTWTSIAEVRASDGQEGTAVMEAYRNAFKFAQQSGKPKRRFNVCKALVKFCKSKSEFRSELSNWEGELDNVLEMHPDVGLESGEESDSERLEHDSEFETPESLSEMETDEEEEYSEEVPDGGGLAGQSDRTRGVAVRKKSKIYKTNEKGETLLHVAAIQGNLAAAKQLITEVDGANVNARDNCGWLPLHEACNHGNADLVSCLLDNGANVNDCGGVHCGGVSSLIDAASNGHMEIVRLLVERGANVCHKDAKGRTAADVLGEMLSAAAESNEHYELEEEHAAIRDYLRREMRKKGWVEEEVEVVDNLESSRTLPRVGSKGSLERRRSGSGGSKMPPRSRVADRTGWDVLLSSDEEDGSPIITTRTVSTPKRPAKEKKNHNPFQSFTVGRSSQPSTSRAASRPSSSASFASLERGNQGATLSSSSRHVKGFYNPLGQVELPALIPENERRIDADPIAGACPVIDHWLVDDVGQPPSKRRKGQVSDPFHERDIVRSSTAGKGKPLSLKRHFGGGKGKSKERSTTSATSQSRKRAEVIPGVSTTVLLSDSDYEDEDMDFWSEACKTASVDSHHEFGSSSHAVPPRSSVSHPSMQLPHPAHSTLHRPSRPSHSTTSLNSTPAPTPLPLRIRIKIETKSYLIPCPVKLTDGSDSTVEWLAKQAAERHYAQLGVRPRLSLTTADGALLSAEDVVAHVLQSGEEVVGVVEHWHLPPLPERYQTSCSNAGADCHKKTLKFFQTSPNASVFNLSHLSLRPIHAPPLFTSLQAHSNLTSLNLCGNRLKNDAMTLLANGLAHHPSLHVLDLSCTGITAQGLKNLCSPTSVSTFHCNTAHSMPWSKLRELFLGYNPLGPSSGPALSSLLSLTSGLLELGLQSCGLEETVLERHTGLGQSLRGLSSLMDISVSLNPLQSGGIALFLHSLPTNHLSHLELANTCTQRPLTEALGQPKVIEFFNQTASSLELLNVSHCPLGEEGMLALCRVLQHCRHLQELGLAAVGLTVESVHPLCRLIENQSSLKVLNASGNEGLGNQGCEDLLHSCTPMVELRVNLAACGMHSPLPSKLTSALSERIVRDKIEIAGNRIDESDHVSILQQGDVM